MPIRGLFGTMIEKKVVLKTTTCLYRYCARPLAVLANLGAALFGLGATSSRAQELTQDHAPSLTPMNLAGEAPTALPSLPEMLPDTDPVFTAPLGDGMTMFDLLGLSAFGGVMLFALLAGWSLIRARRDANRKLRQAHQALQILQGKLDQSESLLNATNQLMIVWDHPNQPPNVTGTLADHGRLPQGEALLAFGNWLTGGCAQQIEAAIDLLRSSGQRFVQTAETFTGQLIEIHGRTSGARILLQMRILEGEEHDRAQLEHETARLSRELGRLTTLLDQVPMPVWSRDEKGQLCWINEAYRKAVDGASIDNVVNEQLELLDHRGREAVTQAHEAGADKAQSNIAVERLPVIAAGKRRIFDVIDIAAQKGSMGIASDVSQMDAAEKALTRMQSFHANTMDQLTTPVAIFDSNQQLQFYNAAYSSLFKLDPGFLDQNPTDSAVLDKLRANRKLPEQADFHGWKAEFLSGYRSVDTQEHWWHLPDGQSLRVVAAANPDGGVTYIFENVTERLDLEKRYNALIRVQTETLDHLSDGVVVFGSDGRVRVSNPAFARLWSISENMLQDQPHVAAVLEWCRRNYGDEAVWAGLMQSVTGLADKRESVSGRMECKDERVLDYAAIPLPDGATMVTFVDVTDNVKVERGLVDENEALMAADQLKNTFIQHVSYELRSPLTNIIGFTELLTSEAFGSLNDKQRDYTDHIMTSSSSLLAIVNDILDLATIDAGIMALEVGEVDPVDSIRAAAEGLQDRLAEKDLRLNISIAEDLGHFMGDSKRVRQVLFNLISNAITFSDERSEIAVLADRTATDITFTVRDQGCGMPDEFVASAFSRFEARNQGPTRKGAGLGLSIVKSFVELHGGVVTIHSSEGEGTTVICQFPIEPKQIVQAAE